MDKGWYYDLGVDVALPKDFSLGAHYGWTRFNDSDVSGSEYNDWKVNAGYSYKGFDFELAYTDTASWDSGAQPKDIADGRVIFSIGRTF